MRSYGPYFRSPFPKAVGFSPYRMPGLLLHVPVIVGFVLLGAWACLQQTWLAPFLVVYAVVGVYWGRDLAIVAHYLFLITFVVLAALLFGLPHLARLPRPHPATSLALTGSIAILFWLYVRWRAGGETVDTPALHFAVRSLEPAAIVKTLEGGADVNEKDTAIGWGYTALHVASALAAKEEVTRIVPVLELLVARGADVNARSSDGETALHLAVEKGSAPLARKLLELGAEVNAAATQGVTPLFLATRRGKRELIELLLAAGADLSARGYGMTPLAEAARREDFALFEWLLEKGAPANDDSAVQLLAGSAEPRALTLMQRLLDAGARVSDELLVRAPTAAMVRFLGSQGARADRLPQGKDAARTHPGPDGRIERLQALRELGCNVAAPDSMGRTLLHAFAASPDELARLAETLPLLLGWGIDINARDEQGNTALHRLVALAGAIHAPPADALARSARILIEAGADPRLANVKGEDCAALAKRLKAPSALRKTLAPR